MTGNRMHLYEIADEWRVIDQAIDDMDGEITPEIEARMDELAEALPETVDAIAKLIRERTAAAAVYAAEAKRLADKAKACQSTVERLKAYLHHHLEAIGLDGVNGTLFKVSIVKNSRPSIKWPGRPESIPDAFRRVSVDLDGPAAYAAWKSGTLPDGFDVAHGSHPRIT